MDLDGFESCGMADSKLRRMVPWQEDRHDTSIRQGQMVKKIAGSD
jgi:hypothetical protein